MSNHSDLKPWFREDIARGLISIYFTSKIASSPSVNNNAYRSGFATALSSIAIMVGINPEQVLEPDDIKLLRDLTNS